MKEKKIIILTEAEPIESKDWSKSYGLFANALHKELGENIRMILSKFSTTDDVAFGAFQICLMETVKEFLNILKTHVVV